MGINNTFNTNVGGVDIFIDTAYDNVKKVADNLERLLPISDWLKIANGIYLGEFTAVPTARADQSPIENGDHYFNSSVNLLYVYLDGSWIYHSIFYTQESLNEAVGEGPFNIWVAYADDIIGNGISLNPLNKNWVGFANNRATRNVDIGDPGIFTWMRFKGDAGTIGVSPKVHIAYGNSADGVTGFNFTTGDYIGIYTDLQDVASNDPVDYNWSRLKGDPGAQGDDGEPGSIGDPGSIIVEAPLTPTNVVATVSPNSVKLTWDVPTYSGHWYTKVYRTMWDGLNIIGFSEIFLIAKAGIDFIDVTVLSSTNYLYWVRHVNLDGVESNLSNGGTGLAAKTGLSLKEEEGWLTAANIEAAIAARLDLIDSTVINGEYGILGAYNALQNVHDVLSNAHNILSGIVGDSGSGIIRDLDSLTSQYNLLNIKVGDEAGGMYSGLTDLSAVTDAHALWFTALGSYDTVNNRFSTIDQLLSTTSNNADQITSLTTSLNTSNINIMPNFNFEGTFTDHLVGGVIDNVVFESGANSYKINSGAQYANAWVQYVSDGFPEYAKDQTYTIGFWAKNTTSGIKEFGYRSTAGSYGNLSIPAASDWAWYTVTFTIPVDLTTYNDVDGDYWAYQLLSATAWDGAVNIDRIILIRGSHVLEGNESFTTNEAAYASASAIDSLNTSVVNINDELTVQASKLTSLGTWDGAKFSLIDAHSISVAGLEAHYVLKTNVNGHIAGFGLSTTTNSQGNTTSEFAVLADKILLATTVDGQEKHPFYIEGTDIFMDTAFIKNLTAAKITSGTINTNNINIGSEKLSIHGAAQGAGKGAFKVNDGIRDIVTLGYLSPSTIGLEINDTNGNTVIKSGVTVAEDIHNSALVGDIDAAAASGGLPPGMHRGGFGDVRFVKNYASGGVNDGEILVRGSKFYHPDGTTRVITDNKEVSTSFEGASVRDGVFYLIYSDTAPTTRFSGFWTSGSINSSQFFIAEYVWTTKQWRALDNNNVEYNFTPVDTDCIVAIGRKTSVIGGIDNLSSLIGVNINLPQDGATIGADWNTNLAGKPNDSKLFGNMIDPNSWVVGTNGTQGNFSQNGGVAKNLIVLGIGPYGNSEPLWKMIGNGTNSADGGWNNVNIPIDPKKSYRYTVWAYQTSTDGTIYLGCGENDTNYLNGNPNTNPYFWVGDLPQLNKWYLIVGICHGSDYAGVDTGQAGVYDPATGTRILAGTEYKNNPASIAQVHRAYQYYTLVNGTEAFFCRPRMDELNGNEISIYALMQPSALLNSNTTPQDIGYTGDLDADKTDYTDERIATNKLEGGVLRIPLPGGAQYYESSSYQGALKIALPVTWNNAMVRFFIDVYNYSTGTSFTVEVGGYLYASSTNWLNYYARITGSTSTNHTIRLGHDGTKVCVWIGELSTTWSYVQVSVRDFRASYSNYTIDAWKNGWAISRVTSFQGIVNQVLSNNLISSSDTVNVNGIAASVISEASARAQAGLDASGVIKQNVPAVHIPNLTLDKLQSGDLGAIINLVGASRLNFSLAGYLLKFGLGFGSSNQFFMWYGPNVAENAMTEANSVFHITTSGGVKLQGTLHVGQLQSSITGTELAVPSSTILGPFGSDGGAIVINYAYSYQHSGSRDGNQSYSGAMSATVKVYKKVGNAAETLLTTIPVSGSMQTISYEPELDKTTFTAYMAASGTYTDTEMTTQPRTYRIEVVSASFFSVPGNSSYQDNLVQRKTLNSSEG